MVQFHPVLSGFPVAFLFLLVCVEVARLRWRSSSCEAIRAAAVIAIFVGSLLSFVSGYQASDSAGTLSETVTARLSDHHAMGRFLLINSFLLLTFWKIERIAVHARAMFVTLYLVFLIVQIGLTIEVGHLGGDLVFEHGVGVSPIKAGAAGHP